MRGMNVRRKFWYEILKGRAFGIHRARLVIQRNSKDTGEVCVGVH